MTREQCEQLDRNHEVMVAWLNGKKIQVKKANSELDRFQDLCHETPQFDAAHWEWRIKPEPKLRPWKPEEVPVGAWIKGSIGQGNRAQILSVSDGKVYFVGNSGMITFNYIDQGLMSCEHSLDNGKTWLPCGKMEE